MEKSQLLSVKPLTMPSRACLVRVKSGRDALKFRCPLYPRKQTSAGHIGMSAKGHKRTSTGFEDLDLQTEGGGSSP
jgi:hypothetical protein